MSPFFKLGETLNHQFETVCETMFGEVESQAVEALDLPGVFRTRSHSYVRAIQAGCSQDDDCLSVFSMSGPQGSIKGGAGECAARVLCVSVSLFMWRQPGGSRAVRWEFDDSLSVLFNQSNPHINLQSYLLHSCVQIMHLFFIFSFFVSLVSQPIMISLFTPASFSPVFVYVCKP